MRLILIALVVGRGNKLRYGIPLNFLHDWQNQINHLLIQEEAYHRELSDEVVEILRELSNKEQAA
jgi:hypothetical protein